MKVIQLIRSATSARFVNCRRLTLVAVRLSSHLLLTWILTASLFAQEAESPAEVKPTSDKLPTNARYVGIENCGRCHAKPEPGRYPTDFVLLNESNLWEQHDKHSQAFRLLVGVTTDENGTRINSKTLGITMLKRLTGDLLNEKFERLDEVAAKTSPEFLQAAKSPVDVRQVTKPYLDAAVDLFLDSRSQVGFGCLTCHANLKSKESYNNVDLEKSFREMAIVNAVSCEACHGPSDLWEGPHKERVVERKHLLAAELAVTPENGFEKSWRELTPEQKMKFGFIEVRNPAVRAQQCFSCHIGDHAEGKFIPHQWYVAGHPPLPSIELSTFANEMPRHWRHVPEKGKFDKRDEFLTANQLAPEALHDLPETKAVLVGGMVALRKSIELMAGIHAEKSFLPNFAGYDCLSCHQELRNEPVFTRDRFDPLVPGRPGLPRWSTALVEAGYMVLDPSGQAKDDFHQQFDSLRNALGKRPFGDRKLVQEACNKLIPALREREESLAKIIITTENAKQVNDELLHAVKTERLDFHTARQLAWAIRRVETELASPIPDFATQEGNAAAQAFDAWLQGPRLAANEKVSQRLSGKPSIMEMLSLPLPARQENSIYRNLEVWLKSADQYDPQQFQQAAQQFDSAQE